jgi:hypothetical protein
MPTLTSPIRRVGRLVAEQCRRLHAALESLAAEVRATIARAVGRAAGEATREALLVVLHGPPGAGADDPRDDQERLWGQPRRHTWPARPYDPRAPERYDAYARDRDDDLDDPAYRSIPADDEPAEGPAEAPRSGAWSRAVATGCQAASWWLRRHPGRCSLLAAGLIGVAAGLVALVGGPLAAAGSAVAAAAWGVLELADAARSAAGLAADATH